VALPPGRDKLSTIPVPTASGTNTNTIGTVRVACCIALMLGGRCQDDIGCERYDFHRVSAIAIGLTRRPSHVDVDVAADCPPRLL